MKTITLHPIWAWAIINGHKRVENRCWGTPHRGPLAIHAGVNRTTEADDRAFLTSLGVAVPHDLPTGVILGTVELVACTPYAGALTDDPLACGPVCWILKNPKPFANPITARGQLRLWDCQLPEGFTGNDNGSPVNGSSMLPSSSRANVKAASKTDSPTCQGKLQASHWYTVRSRPSMSSSPDGASGKRQDGQTTLDMMNESYQKTTTARKSTRKQGAKR